MRFNQLPNCVEPDHDVLFESPQAVRVWQSDGPDSGWIDTLGIDASFQRKGVARMLMDEMLYSMKKIGVNKVYALVNWQDWTFLQFFEALGFKRGDIINLELENE